MSVDAQNGSRTPLLRDDTGQQYNSEQRRRNYGSSENAENSSNSERNGPPKNEYALDNNRSTLGFLERIGFGLGHIFNDLCAGVWFSYTLLFMQAVLLLPAIQAGALVMLGQVGDALATPIIGLLTDRYSTKRVWHIIGTFFVFSSFPMIFSLCPWCTTAPKWWPLLYFAFFIIIFQFAWACVQITHFAMISEMSLTQKDRSDLSSVRYAGSVCSNVIVYVITWFMLKTHGETNNGDNIGPKDAFRFRDIALILVLIGSTMTVLFHFSLSLSGYERRRLCYSVAATQGSEEQQTTRTEISSDRSRDASNVVEGENEQDHIISSAASSVESNKMRKPLLERINFFKSFKFYQNGFLFVFARLFMTTSMIYLPLWLDERAYNPNNSTDDGPILPEQNTTNIVEQRYAVLTPMTPIFFAFQDVVDKSGVEHLATVPLVSFLSCFLTSILLKQFNDKIGHFTSYLIGSLIGLGACLFIAFYHSNSITTVWLYSIAVLFGAGSSITMISSICIIADMIGGHVYQGGLIYSVVTFADKFITGIVIVIIESLKCKDRAKCPQYYKGILAYGCGLAAVLGILVLSTRLCRKIGRPFGSNRSRGYVVI